MDANPQGIDAVINRAVAQIWAKYDVDNNGTLDMDEAKAFVREILEEVSGEGMGFDDSDFARCFR